MSGLVRKSALTGANSVFRSGAPWSMKMGTALFFRRAPMMPQPALRSNRQNCDGLRFCATLRGRLSTRYRNGIRLPFVRGRADNPGIDVMGQDRKVSVFTERTDT
jgi:hypothetical protein